MFDSVSTLASPLQQDDAYRRTLRLVGAGVGETAGYLSLHRKILGIPLVMIPRFVCMDPAGLIDQLPGGPVILSPDTLCPDLANLGALPVAAPATVAVRDLSLDFREMRATMHQKWRNRLHHAEKSGLRITCQPMPPDPGHWLLRAEEAQARQRNYRGWTTALTLAWVTANPKASRLFVALKGREPIAAMLFLLHGNAATYHIGHTTQAGRTASAHNLLMWTAMQTLGRRGSSQIDLGRIDVAKAPGLARFKLGCGARRVQLGGTWLWWRPVRPIFRLMTRRTRRP